MDDPLRVPLTELKDKGEIAVSAKVPAASFDGALTEGALKGPVSVEGTVRPVDDEAMFEGSASGLWAFECSRCLAPVPGEWTAPLELLAPIDGGPMDLNDEVRQAIALAQPMKALCRPDCQGLCPTCRADRNKKDCGHPLIEAAKEGPQLETRKPRLTRKPPKG